jgi:hypothetical protein
MIPDDVMPAPVTGTFINPCDVITQTVLDLDYYKDYATVPHHVTIVVPAASVSQFATGQTITVTYDANNTITGIISSISGTSISFLVTGVTTNAVPVVPYIYDNITMLNTDYGNLSSTFWIFNNPAFPQPPNSTSGNNYIFQTVTIGLLNNSGSDASVTLQINDPVSGSIYVSPITNVIPPSATIVPLTYPFYNCIIPNGHTNVQIQYNSTQSIRWQTTTLNSISYYGTVTGYPVSYTSGIVTVNAESLTIGPGLEPSGTPSGLFITKDYNVENQREILQQLGILLNGSYRENMLDAGVYNYVEKYIRTAGSAPFGLYVYNFGMDANNATYQPSGAINMSKFSTIELEFTTYPPPLDPSANFYTICDPETGIPIGVNKPQWRIYDYNYDLTVLEERYNVLTFIGGNCALMYAR